MPRREPIENAIVEKRMTIARRIVDPMASADEKDRRAAGTAGRLFAGYPPARLVLRFSAPRRAR